ncbi:hypothetical protein [Synechococcus sp. CCY9202]|uniref:hypothetical protein n=1 Tax=Synechococcus sp. CCY9202 TaxID=174698 RepID=UPI002B1F1E18|nr:hypothetical protein [Synechococcus sp. CCY9202]MEA5421950.1 hypothetical protein [Synechococcus sp. CCY9202]
MILTALIAVLGIVALAARNSESQLSSIRQSDAATAKEAAEYGMNEIIGKLNSDAFGYLWVTNWNSSASPPNWVSVTTANLAACNIDISGTPGTSSLVGIKSLSTISTAKYQLTNFVPPQFPPGSSADASCTMFGNLFGGSASITVRGSLQRPSGTEVSNYELTRRVHVIGPVGSASNLGDFPLLLTGPGSRLNKADGDFVQASSPSTNVNSATDVPIACTESAGCLTTTPSATAVVDLSSITMPVFPTPTSLGDPTGRDPNGSAVTQNLTDTVSNYPYTGSVPGSISDVNANLRSECKLAPSSSPTSIICLLNTITVAKNKDLTIDTTHYPINIFVKGDIQIQQGGLIGAKIPSSNWSRLRVYGSNSGSSCGGQDIRIEGSGSFFQGAFSWFPKANVEFGNGGGGGNNANNFGIMWMCKFTGPGSENQAWGAPVDGGAGLGTIFGSALPGGANDTVDPGSIPSSLNFYRGYGGG